MTSVNAEMFHREYDRNHAADAVYQEHGYDNRGHYLRELAHEFAVSESDVEMLADLLGPNEDFDGLVRALEDYQEWMGDSK